MITNQTKLNHLIFSIRKYLDFCLELLVCVDISARNWRLSTQPRIKRNEHRGFSLWGVRLSFQVYWLIRSMSNISLTGKIATIHQNGNDKEKARYHMKPHLLTISGHELTDKPFWNSQFLSVRLTIISGYWQCTPSSI